MTKIFSKHTSRKLPHGSAYFIQVLFAANNSPLVGHMIANGARVGKIREIAGVVFELGYVDVSAVDR